MEREKYGLDGDKAEVYFTDVLKAYGSLPEIEGETYTFESILWDEIAHAGLKIRWFNEPFYHTEYLSDGATAHLEESKINNFETYTLLIVKRM